MSRHVWAIALIFVFACSSPAFGQDVVVVQSVIEDDALPVDTDAELEAVSQRLTTLSGQPRSAAENVNVVLAVFTSYEVYLTAAAVVAIMTFLKKAIRILGKEKGSHLLTNPWVEIALSVGNIALGSLFGLIPNFLIGSSIPERMMLGAVTGLMSNTLYSILRRILPNQMESGVRGDSSGSDASSLEPKA